MLESQSTETLLAQSTGFLECPHARASVMGDSNDRLRWGRARAGFRSAAEAARRFGWKYSTYVSHENGQTPVPPEMAPEYAVKLKIPGGASWLMYGDKAPKGSQKSRLVELAEKMPVELEPQAADYMEFLLRQNRRQQKS